MLVETNMCSCFLQWIPAPENSWRGYKLGHSGWRHYYYVEAGDECPVCGGQAPGIPHPYGVGRFGPAMYYGDIGDGIKYMEERTTDGSSD